jgi:hypothetical protein
VRAKWPVYVAVGVLSVAAGTLIAGLPGGESSTSDVIISSTTVGQVGTTTPASVASEPPVPTTVAEPVTTASTPEATSTTAAPTTLAPTTVAPTTAAPTTAAPTTVAPTTTGAPSTTAGSGTIDDRVDVSIVLANGDGRFNLVGRNRDRLLKLGYFIIDQQDVSDRPPSTIIYYRPGFEDEAERLAGDLQTPNAVITELPDTPVTVNDAAGELVVVLGPDAIR